MENQSKKSRKSSDGTIFSRLKGTNVMVFLISAAILGILGAVGLMLDEHYNNKSKFQYAPPDPSSAGRSENGASGNTQPKRKNSSSSAENKSAGTSASPEAHGSAVESINEDSASTDEKAEEYTAQFPMDINTASEEDLMKTEGIGKSTADKILSFRSEKGVITSMDQLTEINGIGEKTVERLKEYFYVTEDAYAPYIPEAAQPQALVSESDRNTSDGSSALAEDNNESYSYVHINYAGAKEIARCLLISDKKANDIVALREQITRISGIEELILVDSLSEKEIVAFSDYVIID